MKFLLLLLPVFLLASTVSPERQVKWLLAAERTLNSPEYCQKLPELLKAPEADPEVRAMLQKLLEVKCQGH